MSNEQNVELMKAQVLIAPQRLIFTKLQIPGYKKDEVLVKLITAAICNGSDPNMYKGYTSVTMPMVFGHEPYGEVVACGSEVRDLKPGDRISWWCSFGAFAEYIVVNPSKVSVAKIPNNVNEKEAPLVELVLASARAIKAAGIGASSRILILGLGPSGLIMSQIAKIQGASRVIGWDLYPMRRNVGLELGCDAVFDPSIKGVAEMTGSEVGDVDIIIDAMGNDLLPGEPTLDMAVRLMANGGRVVSYGHPSNGRRINTMELQSRNGCLFPPEQNMDEIRKLTDICMKYIAAGQLRLAPLVSEQIPLSRVELGLKMVMDHPDKYLKLIVNIEERQEEAE